MDEKDIRILHAAAARKTASPERIHEATGIPKSTVHYRLKELRKDGTVTDDLQNVDLNEFGLSITLVSEIWAEFSEGYHETVGEKLSAIEGVNQVYFTLGDTDFVVISHLPSRKHVEDIVGQFEKIGEINRTSSKFVISTIKNEPNPVSDYAPETLTDFFVE